MNKIDIVKIILNQCNLIFDKDIIGVSSYDIAKVVDYTEILNFFGFFFT